MSLVKAVLETRVYLAFDIPCARVCRAFFCKLPLLGIEQCCPSWLLMYIGSSCAICSDDHEIGVAPSPTCGHIANVSARYLNHHSGRKGAGQSAVALRSSMNMLAAKDWDCFTVCLPLSLPFLQIAVHLFNHHFLLSTRIFADGWGRPHCYAVSLLEITFLPLLKINTTEQRCI